MTRLLAIMGSGETAPTMTKVHRALLARSTGTAVLLDTPYGFQTNASDISARTVDYFRVSLNTQVGVASLLSADVAAIDRKRALNQVRDAGYVFAGPGSPSYALRTWATTDLAAIITDKLRPGGSGGVVVFASAAALTLGTHTVPVYEVYKAGESPYWLSGLDLISLAGLNAVVIPHFDNAEGGNHDTRYCYLGEDRLSKLERELPEESIVLGVDEHTACIFDLDTQTVEIMGRGVVTVRRRGCSVPFAEGKYDTASLLVDADAASVVTMPAPVVPMAPVGSATSLGADTERLSAAFDSALDARDALVAAAAALDLDSAIVDWASDTTQSDAPERARAALRSMIARLGELAVDGIADPRTVVGPYVEAALQGRTAARDAKAFAVSDVLRDALLRAGIEVRDTPSGQEWVMR